MANGMPYETYAAVISVNRDTLYHWEKLYPEFSDAKKIGKEKQYLALYKLGLSGMTGNLKTLKSETTTTTTRGSGDKAVTTTTTKKEFIHHFGQSAWIFMMKNMCEWKDSFEFYQSDFVDTLKINGKKVGE
jgi:hypothetical protein